MADALGTIADTVVYYLKNFYHNATHILDDMDATRWLRLVAVVGAYLLFRPLILKFGAKVQAAEHEKEVNFEEEKKKKAKISANALRGDESEDEEEEEVEVTGAEPQWGKKARKRSRKVVREILEAQERLLEEDDNEDIKEFLESDILVDFEEGKDGW
jgi:hypothetical protein